MATGPFQVAALVKHTATVIFLHGLGDTGAGWLPVAKMLNKALPHVKWLLPNAPERNISVSFGMQMPGWFDIYSFELGAKEDRDGLLESACMIDKLIQEEIDGGIPAERIVVGGFSQGGTMSLLTGLAARDGGLFGGRDGWKLGGVVSLSGWLPLNTEFPKMVSPHLAEMSVLMCHGTEDPIVPFKWGKMTRDILTNNLHLPLLTDLGERAAGLNFRSYNSLGHETCQQELEDLALFLKRVLPS